MESKEHTQITKRKRTKCHRSTSPLSPPMATTSSTTTTTSPSTSINKPSNTSQVEQDTAKCLILLAQGQITPKSPPPIAYQCKTCTRGFPSFQALGGHRASHKKPKAIIEDCKLDGNNTSTTLSLQLPNKALSTSTNTKSKVHECSICGAEFTSGQALGGHMRRHRTIIPMAATSGSNPSENDTNKPKNFLSLDLNLPAPDDDHGGPKLPFAAKEQVIVFSASSLVDCHY